MVEFVCPNCGHESLYDPRQPAVLCSQCGHLVPVGEHGETSVGDKSVPAPFRVPVVALVTLAYLGIALWLSILLFETLWIVGLVGFGLMFFGLKNVITREARIGASGFKRKVRGTHAVVTGILRVINGLAILGVAWYVVRVYERGWT